jgi:hypothetical protein
MNNVCFEVEAEEFDEFRGGGNGVRDRRQQRVR